MKHKLMKVISTIIIFTLFVLELHPVLNDKGEISIIPTSEPVQAASSFKVAYKGATYDDGSLVDYDGAESKITLVAPASDTYSIDWTSSHSNVAQVNTPTGAITGMQIECNLTINGPGYTGLNAIVYSGDRTRYLGSVSVTLHVPLAFNDYTDSFGLKQEYGLILAQTTDAVRTLQLFTEDSGVNSNKYHFLRRIKNVEYISTDGTITDSNIHSADLSTISTAIPAEEIFTWSSSDNNVVTVDGNGGVTAVGAGFARITVQTATAPPNGAPDSLSYNVVVSPEGRIASDATAAFSNRINAEVSAIPIVIQTNALIASTLDWNIYPVEPSTNGGKNSILKKLGEDFAPSSINGRLTISNLPAGKYYIIGMPKKDDTPPYDLLKNENVNKLIMELTVPLVYPQGPVVMNVYSDDLFDTYDIFANSNFPANAFQFSSNHPSIVDVSNPDGIVSAMAEGEAIISLIPQSAALEEVFGPGFTTPAGSLLVKVLSGMTLSATNETIYLGATHQLQLTSPSPYDGKIEWSSSDESVLTVSEHGLVTATGVGEATVTVKIKVGGVTKRARCKYKVVTSINEIVLTAKSNSVSVGESINITAKITPNINNATLEWRSSDPAIANIIDTTNLTATIEGVSIGTVVISAVNKQNIVVGTIIIHVVEDVTALTLSDTEVNIPLSTGFYQLYATTVPELPINEKITWTSSNSKIATVDQNGKVTLVKPGTVVITATTANGLLANCTFNISQAITAISLDIKNKDMYVGETYRITYSVKPATATDISLRWTTSNPSAAVVDSNGLVTAKGVGQTVITAITNDGSAIFTTCTINVKRTAKSLKLDVSSLTLNVGDFYNLDVTLNPVDSTDSITFETSNPKVVTVSKRGRVTGKAAGTAIIIAKTDTGMSTFCSVIVNQAVEGVNINEDNITIDVDDEFELTYTITPKGVTDDEVVWESSDTSVAKVNKRGEVTGIAGGMAIITCTTVDGGYVDFCVVMVEELVTDIKLNETNYKLGVDRSFQLIATISGERATNKKVKWKSSRKSVVTVNANGRITGIKEGYATITATARDGSGAEATCEVRVVTQAIGLEVEPTFITLVQGKARKLKASILPSNATFKTPIWSTADDTIAIVNSKGTVTGLKPGTTIVTATANDSSGLTSTCYVNVIAPVYATGVTFSSSEVVMTPGETKTVPFSIVPNNTTEKHTWSSDNPAVATVNSKTGKINARSIGSASITLMTDSGKKGTIQVYVVGLSRTSIELAQYDYTRINLEVDGRGASNLKVRWDTDNQNIAEVVNGKITGRALGQTKVYAVVNGRYLECKVKVVKNR